MTGPEVPQLTHIMTILVRDYSEASTPVSVSDAPECNVTESQNATMTAHLPPLTMVILGVFLGLAILCAVLGNVLVCVAILTDRNLRKSSNYFYVSLAVADLMVGCVVMTFALANDLSGYWPFGRVTCDIWLSADVMCSTASILHICTISLDRFLHVKDPYHYDSRMTVKRTLLVIAFLWLLSTLISFLPIHLDWHKTRGLAGDDTLSGFTCVLDLNPIYAVTSSLISFYIPCVVMILIYVKLFLYARKHVRNIKRNSTWGSLRMSSASRSSYKASDHKAAITLGVIMGTFLVCWLPFFVINVISALQPGRIPPVLFSIFTWLGYLNSLANPIIYPVFNMEFRMAFKRILIKIVCSKRTEVFNQQSQASVIERLPTGETPPPTLGCCSWGDQEPVDTCPTVCVKGTALSRDPSEDDVASHRKTSDSPLIQKIFHSSSNLDKITVV